jgi:hypothetical protein
MVERFKAAGIDPADARADTLQYFTKTFKYNGKDVISVVKLITADTPQAKDKFAKAMSESEMLIYVGLGRCGSGPDFDDIKSPQGELRHRPILRGWSRHAEQTQDGSAEDGDDQGLPADDVQRMHHLPLSGRSARRPGKGQQESRSSGLGAQALVRDDDRRRRQCGRRDAVEHFCKAGGNPLTVRAPQAFGMNRDEREPATNACFDRDKHLAQHEFDHDSLEASPKPIER